MSYIGGTVDRFCQFSYMLGDDQPVYGLQTPLDLDYFKSEGFDMEKAGVDCICNTTSHYVSLVLAQNPHGPFALAGYSYGGFIAREMAKQLLAMGKQVTLLAMFDTVVPGTRKSLLPPPEGKALNGWSGLNYRQKLLRQNFGITWYDNAYLLKNDGKKWVRNKMQLVKQFFGGRKTGKAKAELSARAKELSKYRKMLAVEAQKNYPLEFYDGEIVLFRARKLSSYSVNDFFLGWRPYCKSIKVYKVDGDHVFIFNPFYSMQLAKRLQRVLDQRQAKEKNVVPHTNVLFEARKKTVDGSLKK